MNKIRVGTVFSGIGAFEFALRRLNVDHELVFACDNGERDVEYDVEKERTVVQRLRNAFQKKKYVDDLSKEHIYYILMVDIDSFKKINDTYGHIEGDRALRFTARILRTSTIHNGYYIARYGGDEFMIIARTESENDIINTIDLINTKMKESKNELNYEITTSIGYSVLNKGENIEAAVERADNMLYEKKKIVHK